MALVGKILFYNSKIRFLTNNECSFDNLIFRFFSTIRTLNYDKNNSD